MKTKNGAGHAQNDLGYVVSPNFPWSCVVGYIREIGNCQCFAGGQQG